MPLNGSDMCRNHIGQGREHAEIRATEGELQRAADRLGIRRPVDPAIAFLDLISEAAGNVEFYRSIVEQLATYQDDDEFVSGEGDGHWERAAPGIVGRTYHVSGIPTGEAKRSIYVQMYDDERDRLEKYVSDALRYGLEERRVRMVEAESRDLLAGVMHAAQLAALTQEQIEVFRRGLAEWIRNRPRGGNAQLAS